MFLKTKITIKPAIDSLQRRKRKRESQIIGASKWPMLEPTPTAGISLSSVSISIPRFLNGFWNRYYVSEIGLGFNIGG